MGYKRHIFYLFIFLLVAESSPAQNKIIDSLKISLKTEKGDTNKVNMLNDLSRQIYLTSKYDTALYYASAAKLLAEKIIYKKGLANAYNNIGNIYFSSSNYPSALKNHLASLKIRKEIGDNLGIGNSNNNIGNICFFQGNYPEALKSYLAAMDMYNTLPKTPHMSRSLAGTYNNIGNIYYDQNNYPEALKNYFSALKIFIEIEDKYVEAACYANIGIVYFSENKYPEALKNDSISLNRRVQIGDEKGIAASYGNIGIIYFRENKYSAALKNFFASIAICEKINDKEELAEAYINIAAVYQKQNKIKEGSEYINKSLTIGKTIGNKEIVKESFQTLIQLDSAEGNYRSALADYKNYILYRDSLFNQTNTKKIVQAQMQYDFNTKTVADSIKNVEQIKQQALANKLQIQQQKIYTYAGIVGFLLMLLVAGFLIFAYRNKQKANTVLEEKNEIIKKQKLFVEEKNKEITSSINYALRIQKSMLPLISNVKKYLSESFIVYQPKDIVAGDFYWMEPVENKILIAACDCTGHGVPGAMVSVVCYNALNRAVREFGLTQPAAILDKTAQMVIENFSKSEDEIKDGMDISLCAIEKTADGINLQWAGANSPLWILQNGELVITKADKQPIGYSQNYKPFTNHTITLKKGDTIYLFSDGYADQFGGENGKKMTQKRFKDLLLSMQDLTLQEQGEALDKYIVNYRKKIEQTDDILVIGIRV